jgi:RNA polymerase sigma factor (sigma-70 family)
MIHSRRLTTMRRGQLDSVVRHLRRAAGLAAAEELADAQLLERFVADRDEDAFAALVGRYGGLVRSVCRHVLHHEQDTDDAFQGTFLVFASKAASIRKTTSVASWLYGVAYRTAMNAKRARARRREGPRDSRSCSPEQPVTEAALREVQAILDDEVNRLPEKYRAPFVLCCLEGKNRAEVAKELGWKEGTVCSRVARAREALQQRLTRRGVVLTAALCAIELGRTGATAAVKPSLMNCTIKAALSFAAGKAVATDLMSAEVAALAKGVLQSMWPSKLTIATAVLLAVSCVTGAGLLTRQVLAGKPADGQQQALPPKAPEDKNAPGAAPAVTPKRGEGEAVMISGRVLDPQGKPFQGAKLYLWTSALNMAADLAERTTTGDDGRFRFTAARADLERNAEVVAVAKGFGPDWAGRDQLAEGGEVILRLAKDDVPITGRVLDLEGQPVAGATVRVSHLEAPAEGGDLTPWIEIKRKWARGEYWTRGEDVNQVPVKTLVAPVLGVPMSATTDKAGRFRLVGFGRERVAHLRIRGKDVENAGIEVITRAGPVTGLRTGNGGTYAASFDYHIGPGKPIVGRVRDKRTGRPLAGITVAGARVGATAEDRATTDEQGRYRLTGVGKQDTYWVAAEGVPYFNTTKHEVKDNGGLEPLVVDFDLERGIAVKGRLTDKATGKPVQGRVSYLAAADNPNLKDFTELTTLHVVTVPLGQTGPDGAFTVLAIPGPGLLCAVAEDANHYLGAEIEGWDGSLLRTVPADGPHPSKFHAVVSINPAEQEPKSTTCDIALEPGRTRTGKVVGPDGEPLAGAHVAGLTPLPHFGFPVELFVELTSELARERWKGLKTADFTVLGLSPRKARNVVFFHPGKKLGKVQAVAGDAEAPLTVRLEALSGITGRVVDAQGRPWAGLAVHAWLTQRVTAYKDLPWETHDNLGPVMGVTKTTDREGRFSIDGLLPGLKYDLVINDGERRPYYREGLSPPTSGKTADLGELKSKLVPEKQPAEGP